MPKMSPGVVACLAAAAVCLAAIRADAQAWVPPKGAGAVTVSTQVIDNTGHIFTDGFRSAEGQSTDAAIYIEGEYAVTDRLSFVVGLPYVFAKYIATHPAPVYPVDQCRCWNGGWQDFGGTARFNVVNRSAVAITPSVAYGVPSHNYQYQGEAVVGAGLQEIRLAVDGGVRLDPISPKLSMQARYAYGFVEKVLAISHDRSNIGLVSAYQATRRLSARGEVSWQRTHGGLRAGSSTGHPFPLPGEIGLDPERLGQHDRLLRDNNWRLGGSGAYSLNKLDVFASYLHYMGGSDTHAGHALTIGVSWPFGT